MASVEQAPASFLGPVASGRPPALYVIKVGSASLKHERVFEQIAGITRRGARVLLVAGGAEGIREHYARTARPVRTLRLRNGDDVRYCPPEEMAHIVAAYEQVTLPLVRAGLQAHRLSVWAATAGEEDLVLGAANPPMRAIVGERPTIVRDHRAGSVDHVDVARLNRLLSAFDVVVLSPPMGDRAGGAPLNVDADVLAAELAVALGADHLRLVTGTPGLLRELSDPDSRVADLYPGEGLELARGRMRQKVRAAEIALTGVCDVAVTGPHTLEAGSGTRFWRAGAPGADLELLSRAVQINSVSGDEHELTRFLVQWCRGRGIEAYADEAGNLVASRGTGERRLLMLGHLDTVPHLWPAHWRDGILSGRGAVDAKGSLIAFLEALADAEIPDWLRLTVLGTVQEETTSAGAFHARDRHRAEAVVVGEPSGAGAVTIGYYGLYKVRLSVAHEVGHTAGKGAFTAADVMTEVLTRLRVRIGEASQNAMMSALGIHAVNDGDQQRGEAVVDVRVPPDLAPEDLIRLVESECAPARAQVLRATPGVITARTSQLVAAFNRGFREEQLRPRFLAKKGSSDMNTLAQTWGPVPMVAYGPGDAALDHTPDEHLSAEEYRRARIVLDHALRNWTASVRPAPGWGEPAELLHLGVPVPAVGPAVGPAVVPAAEAEELAA